MDKLGHEHVASTRGGVVAEGGLPGGQILHVLCDRHTLTYNVPEKFVFSNAKTSFTRGGFCFRFDYISIFIPKLGKRRSHVTIMHVWWFEV